jgi:putative ABC transport system substrate-binding protein
MIWGKYKMRDKFRIYLTFSQPDNRKPSIRERSLAGIVAIVSAFAMCQAAAHAQQPTKIPNIALLSGGSRSIAAERIGAFRKGLRELGYLEGKNMVIEERYSEGKIDRLSELAADLMRLKIHIIVTTGALPTRAAKQVTVTIPIVMAQDSDPVGNGFVASLARPGGNITGLSSLSADINGKRLELMTETIPRLSRVAVLGTSTVPGTLPALTEMERAAGLLGVKVQFLDIVPSKDIEIAFRTAGKERADAVLLLQSLVLNSQRKKILDLTLKSQVPAMYYAPEWVHEGGLMSYSPSIPDLFRRAAGYVDKILKGAKPAELPVEQPTKFELMINLKTAKQIGLTIPPNVLARADRVIR